MQVRSVADSARKFKERAASARNDYAAGVSGAGQRWQQGTEAAEEAYNAGTQAAISEGRFAKGVRKAGAGKYQANATKLGPERFVTGVANAEGAYSQAVQPFLSALAGAQLTSRGMRGSPQNARRIQETNDLMRKVRRESLGLSV